MTFLWNIFRWVMLAAGALIAPRAMGADAIELASHATKSLAENPELIAFGVWAVTEIFARVFPTRRQASTFFFLRDILNVVGAVFLFAAKVFEQMARSPIAQNVRAPKTPSEPSESPEDNSR